jgi:hypothetical protein
MAADERDQRSSASGEGVVMGQPISPRARVHGILIAVALVLAACGGGDDLDESAASTQTSAPSATSTSGAPAASSSDATCTVSVTGDEEWQTDTPGRIPANSDYWLSDQELQSASQVHPDYDARVAAGQQLLQILQVSCGDPEGVLLMTTDETTRADVPQEPGTYDVLNFLDKAKPGIAAAFGMPGERLFGVIGGEVTITRFDDERVAGSFTLQAEELAISVDQGGTPEALSVSGEFDFPCFAPSGTCR